MSDFKAKAKQSIYYILIGVLSFVALVFLPMLGSDLDAGWVFPTTAAGWVVWAVTRVIVSIVNIMLFHCFICQGKLNVKDNEQYKKANEILKKCKELKHTPRSPHRYLGQQYGKKGVTLVFASLMSTFALTQAILTFDWVSMLSYFFVLLLGVIFGIIQMKSTETYWVEEYYEYALFIQEQQQKENKEVVEAKNDNIE